MSALLKGEKISQCFGALTLLSQIEFEINEGEKIGIVGQNGCGKSTLLEMIAGRLNPSEGQLYWYKPCVIAYMPQVTDEEDERLLSGGERTKKRLREVLYEKHQLLLLDEPTNHLDQDSIKWLIKEIQKDTSTLVVVSHDRYFLDQCVTRMIEIEDGKLKSYSGNYHFYQEEKRKARESQLHAYENQEKRKQKIEAEIETLKGWAQKAHREARAKAIETGNKFGGKEHNRAKAKKRDKQVASKIKRLTAMIEEGVEKPKTEQKIQFTLQESPKANKRVIEAKNIAKAYGKKCLFEKSSFYIKYGEKIGLFGPNGCGKSTLVKALMGEVILEGELFLSEGVKIGYMSQEVTDMNPEYTVSQYLELETGEEIRIAREKLAQMGFSREAFKQVIGTMSRGQQMKLKLLKMILQCCQLLILDEPTNHMDLSVRETLEEVLEGYNGTLLLITHDRYMLEKLCEGLLVFKNNQIIRFEGKLSEYEDKQMKGSMPNKKANEIECLKIEHQLAYWIGVLSAKEPGSEEYQKAEAEYEKWLIQKRSL